MRPSGNSDALPWSGRALLGSGWALFAGRAGDNRLHRHPALQLAIGNGQPVRAVVDGQPIECAGLLIGPNLPHSLQPGPVWLLYVERESVYGRRLAATCRRFRSLSAEDCEPLCAQWEAPADDAHRVKGLVHLLVGDSAPTAAVHASVARVRAVLDELPASPPGGWTLSAMADAASLSPSRFAHLFCAQTGLPVRPYLRWLRLSRALGAASQGETLTDAAHAAGFSDAAHFTRTMRRHFGVTPVDLLASLRGR